MNIDSQISKKTVNSYWRSRILRAKAFQLPVMDPAHLADTNKKTDVVEQNFYADAPNKQTVYAWLLSAFSIALSRVFDRSSFAVSTFNFAGDDRPASGNILLLDIELTDTIKFDDVLLEVKEELNNAYKYRDADIDLLMNNYKDNFNIKEDVFCQLGFAFDQVNEVQIDRIGEFKLFFLAKSDFVSIHYDTHSFSNPFIQHVLTVTLNYYTEFKKSHGTHDWRSLPLQETAGWELVTPIREMTKEPIELPTNKEEAVIASFWKKILNINEIGVNVNFFQAGGNSLKALMLVSEINQAFNKTLLITDIFHLLTIKELARFVTASDHLQPPDDAIEVAEKKTYYDLSYAQRRLWILTQFESDFTAYNIVRAFIIRGDLDILSLRAAIHQLTERHESMRTIFKVVNGEPKQTVVENPGEGLFETDLSHHPVDIKESLARQLFLREAGTVFNLSKGPLFRFHIVRLATLEHLLVFNIHHIISDGWSQGIIQNDLLIFYNAIVNGAKADLPALRLQYKDYSEWHNSMINSGHLSSHGSYWLNKFADKPSGIELPIAANRPAMQTFNGNRFTAVLSPAQTKSIHTVAINGDATDFMVLTSIISIILYNYSGQTDIIIGSPSAGRKQPELKQLVGFFVNTLVFRFRIDPAQSFEQLLLSVKEECLKSYEYEDFPFDLLIDQLQLERDLSRSPIFNVMIAFNNTDTLNSYIQPEGFSIHPFSGGEYNVSKFDLIFFIREIDHQFEITLEYNTDLFSKQVIQHMAQNLVTLAGAVIERPNAPVQALTYIDAHEYNTIIHSFNDNQVTFPCVTVQAMVEASVERNGERTAVFFDTQSLSYNELNRRANQLAWLLIQCDGIKPNDVIGISVNRSIEMIVAVLAIIKTGAGFLALDPSYPADRIQHMIKDSAVKTVITDTSNLTLFEDHAIHIVYLQDVKKTIHEFPTSNPCINNAPTDIVYVIYTSGSTGMPNGALLTHGMLTNLINWQHACTSIDSFGRCLQFTSLNFCVSFQEIFCTLTAGGEIHLIADIERRDVNYLMRFLADHNIDLLYLPFSYLNFLFNESSAWNQSFHHSLKHIITAGEPLKITSGMQHFFELNPQTQLHNHYGSSEMHVVAAHTFNFDHINKHKAPPVGKPIANTKIYILDDHRRVNPVGVWGELYVEGCLPIPGYINNLALTSQKMITIPELAAEKTLYKTGDFGRWLESGEIEVMGRKDGQVKIRGYRIELSEIENKIFELPEVKDCVVVLKADDRGAKMLIAYVVLKDITIDAIKKYLSDSVPQYMVPRFVKLSSLPLMPNGKVDRDQLSVPAAAATTEIVLPLTPVQEKLASIWKEVLNTDQVGIDNNFFELGGHSLKAMKMIGQIYLEFDTELPIRSIYNYPTIRELSECLFAGVQVKKYLLPLTAVRKELSNLVFISPVAGSPTVFLNLAQKLSSRYNIYGLRYKGLDADETFDDSIETMAERCADEINAIQDGGQLMLAGYSMGAAIAFELTKKLETKGMLVKLFLIDKGAKTKDVKQVQKARLSLNEYLQDALEGMETRSRESMKDLIAHNLLLLDAWHIVEKITSDIIAIEAKGNEPATAMENWLPFTSGLFRQYYIDESHMTILNKADQICMIIQQNAL